jgi:hypothetical protein
MWAHAEVPSDMIGQECGQLQSACRKASSRKRGKA